jgi:RNA polymerase sigma-70 factor (ECF subfamily)
MESLLSRIAAGDEGALARLYQESGKLVHGLALRILRNPADAEEVVLDVFIQVWRTAARFDPCRGSAMTWLVMMTRSRALDRLRSRELRSRREEPLGELATDPRAAAPEEMTAREERRRVRAALAAIPPEQRELVELAFFSGFSHREVAARMGQPLGTVKSRIRSGMRRLHELLIAGVDGAPANGIGFPTGKTLHDRAEARPLRSRREARRGRHGPALSRPRDEARPRSGLEAPS